MSNFDPTSRMGLPRSLVRDMTAAVPDKLVRDIVRDHHGKSTSLPSVFGESSQVAGTNILEARPLDPVPYVAHCDRIADHFAALDRRDLKQRLGVKDEPPSAD